MDVAQGDGSALCGLASDVIVKWDLRFVGAATSDNDQEVCIQIVEVERGDGGSGVAVLADKNDVGGVILDQSLDEGTG